MSDLVLDRFVANQLTVILVVQSHATTRLRECLNITPNRSSLRCSGELSSDCTLEWHIHDLALGFRDREGADDRTSRTIRGRDLNDT